MTASVGDANLVAYCGLYCGACRAYKSGKCPGCQHNDKATWCAVRDCCRDRSANSCAECADFADAKDCRKFNNFISRLFGLVFRSDRAACIAQIRAVGLGRHAQIMAESGRQSIRRVRR